MRAVAMRGNSQIWKRPQLQRDQCERGGQCLFRESEFKIFCYEELSKSGLNVGKTHVVTQGKTPGKVL